MLRHRLDFDIALALCAFALAQASCGDGADDTVDGGVDAGADADADAGADAGEGLVDCGEIDCAGALCFADPALERAIRSAISKPGGALYSADVAGLTELNAASEEIESLEGIQCLTSLETLNASYNRIADVSPLAPLTSLTSLSLEANRIADISPLAALTALSLIDLIGNEVSDLAALTPLAALSYIFLDSNPVTDLAPLAANEGLAEGDFAYVTDSPIDAAAQADNIQAISDRGVCLIGDWGSSDACCGG